MNLQLILLIAAPILFFSQSAMATEDISQTILDALNKNSIFRDEKNYKVKAYEDHKTYGNVRKDISKVIITDANGNVQESETIRVGNIHGPHRK